MRKRNKKPSPPVTDALLLWLARNRGVLKWVADQIRPAVTEQFVCMVARGKRKSKDGKVERLLRQKGAPI